MNLTKTQLAGIVVTALAIEFLILEGAAGISLPSDRQSVSSTVAIQVQGTDPHYVTRNYRFSVVEENPNEPVVIREFSFMDRQPNKEGPPDASITVEAIKRGQVKWEFQEPGEHGDVLTDRLYRVVKLSGGENATTYTYFSLADGRKLRTSRSVELSMEELQTLDLSILKRH